MKKLALLCALAAPAFAAADEAGQFYLTPQAGYLWTDHDRSIPNDKAFGLAAGGKLNELLNLELNYNRTTIDTAPGIKLRFDATSADLLWMLGSRNAVVTPFLSTGLGVLSVDPKPGPSTQDLFAQAGIGALWHLGSHFALRPEVKARWDDAGNPHRPTDYLAMLGFQFSFGDAAPAPVARVIEPPPPPPAPVVQAAPLPPPPPADSDHDGVPDSLDQCPNTPPGVAVDAVGCERKGSITLEGVTFTLNSADLLPESRPVLDRVAGDLSKHPRLRIELQGHTDSSGSHAYNLSLSQRRAQSVADYLKQAGVAAGQVTPKGYGETQPIAANTTADGRAQNRRVVMKVLENPGDVQVKGEGQL